MKEIMIVLLGILIILPSLLWNFISYKYAYKITAFKRKIRFKERKKKIFYRSDEVNFLSEVLIYKRRSRDRLLCKAFIISAMTLIFILK